MPKKYNYNYVFVFYDVEEKRCQKVFKVCKKYLTHYQLSVFRGRITPSQIISLKAELLKVINKKKDDVVIIKLLSQHYFEEEILGTKELKGEEEFFI